MRTGTVFDIKEFAVFDGPGIRTTVFLKGCPLRCMWCHNPEGLSPKPEIMVSRASCTHCGACEAVCPSPGACTACGKCVSACPGGFRKIAGQTYTAEALAERLKKDADVYEMSGGGVTFSGGEPLLQWEFVRETIGLLGGIPAAIETGGFVSDEVFASAMEVCDLILIDWKVSDPERHRRYTGADNEAIRRHIEMLAAGNTPFILRMPVIPGVNDEPEHFRTAAKLVKDARSLVNIDVLPYQKAAGAKYEMVGREYAPDFEAGRDPVFYTGIFDEMKLPYKVFR